MTPVEPGLAESFVHFYQRAPDRLAPVLLALHGTGGNEESMVQLAATVAPEWAWLSPRGQVEERGAFRFFRRFSPGVFDEVDLQRRAGGMVAFVDRKANEYGFPRAAVTGLGYSNGANLAAAMLLLHPGSLAGAVLLRPMVPLAVSPEPGSLSGCPVLIAAGRRDPLVPVTQTGELASLLQAAGAPVTVHWTDTGHELTSEDLAVTGEWLRQHRPSGNGTTSHGSGAGQ